jgi:catechol 2,3-dioxygenase
VSLPPTSTHPDTTVGAVHLRVNDLDLARRFYTKMLGLQATVDDAGELLLSADGATPLLRIAEDAKAAPRDPRTTGLYHFALLLPSRAQLGRVLQHLAKTRYELDGMVDHAISEAVYLTDPEGNGIELAADYPRETWGRVMQAAQHDPRIMSRPMDVQRMFGEADALKEEWDGIAPATKMGHVHLHVRDVPEALAFHHDALGFDVMTDLASAAFLSAGGYHHHLGLNVWAGPRAPQPGAVGLRHYTIEYPTESERKRILDRIKRIGGTVEDTDAGPISADPTGNRMLLKVA